MTQFLPIKYLLEPRFLRNIERKTFRNNEISDCHCKACLVRSHHLLRVVVPHEKNEPLGGVVGLLSGNILCWRMIYQMLQLFLMITCPWSYAEYLTQQLMMAYPVIVIWKRSFFVNNRLEELYWQLWFAVTPCIWINKLY